MAISTRLVLLLAGLWLLACGPADPGPGPAGPGLSGVFVPAPAEPSPDASAAQTVTESASAPPLDEVWTEQELEQATDLFREHIDPVMRAANCAGCHAGYQGVGYGLLPSSEANLAHNFSAVVGLIRSSPEACARFHDKPAAGSGLAHTGPKPFYTGDATSMQFWLFIDAARGARACGTELSPAEYAQSLQLLEPTMHMRKVWLNLAGRLPRVDELASLSAAGPIPAAQIEALLLEPASLDHLMTMWNDLLLTDAGATRSQQSPAQYSTIGFHFAEGPYGAFNRWYPEPGGLRGEPVLGSRSTALTRMPLRLVRHLVANDLDFRQIVTADYVMMNRDLYEGFGGTPVAATPLDDADWKPVRLEDFPHAGLLTDLVYLFRYPSSATNRHRKRSHVTQQLFLDTDVLSAGQSGAEVEAGHLWPSRSQSNCVTCHRLLDPIGQLFHDFSDVGWYRFDAYQKDQNAGRTYPPEQVLPMGFLPEGGRVNDGVGGAPDSPGQGDDLRLYDGSAPPLVWLGQRIAEDPRFVRAVVKNVLRGLTGRALLTEDAGAAFQLQRAVVAEAGEAFVQSGHRLRAVFVSLFNSPLYRVRGHDGTIPLEQEGWPGARMLSPERLVRRIRALTGIAYPDLAADFEQEKGAFYLLYGGIDSLVVSHRPLRPSGIVTAAMQRMAAELSCRIIAGEGGGENLLAVLGVGGAPQDESAVRAGIVALLERLLGERRAPNDGEVDRLYEFFGELRLPDSSGGDHLPEACGGAEDPDRALRAWQGLVALMLFDYRFLYD